MLIVHQRSWSLINDHNEKSKAVKRFFLKEMFLYDDTQPDKNAEMAVFGSTPILCSPYYSAIASQSMYNMTVFEFTNLPVPQPYTKPSSSTPHYTLKVDKWSFFTNIYC